MADIVHLSDTGSKINLKKKGKKRKISKHIADAKLKSASLTSSSSGAVLDSTDSGQNNSSNVTLIPTPAIRTATPSKKQKLGKRMKDPVDVEGYLLAWKEQQDLSSDDGCSDRVGVTKWKFNKNTQSWLIRHLYDATKISKSLFAIAVQYFMKSNINVQKRLRDDATQRAIQYQQQHHQQENEMSNHTKDGKNNEDEENTKQNDAEDSPELLLEKNRRKEYKRARKILDSLVVANNVDVGNR
jgi:hypothetical protein